MKDKRPLVSIGMPVYNGEKFICQALDSLLNQDYENFELIISDNHSTDTTREICLDYMAKDRRIRYFRNEMNIGAIKNFNKVFDLSQGEYFMWAADHDVWHSSFISSCASVLETCKKAVLAYAQTMLIDCETHFLEVTPDRLDTRGYPPLKRYRKTIWSLYWCNIVYGLIVRKTMKQIMPLINIWGPDYLILAELSLLGEFIQIPEPLFYRRENRPNEEGDEYKKRVLLALDPNNTLNAESPYENLWSELRNAHLDVVARSNLKGYEKVIAAYDTYNCFDVRFGVNSYRGFLWAALPIYLKSMIKSMRYLGKAFFFVIKTVNVDKEANIAVKEAK